LGGFSTFLEKRKFWLKTSSLTFKRLFSLNLRRRIERFFGFASEGHTRM
jgi:hypothetical protein